MNKLNFSQVARSLKTSISKHSPEILTGIGIAGLITAGVLAVTETPKALKLIEEKKKELHVEKLKPVETVQTTWKCYIPAVATATVSTVCLIGASRVSSKRNAALATAYTLSEAALREYKEKVIETIGEKKEQNIREAIAKDRIENNPVSNQTVIITDKGNTLCYDMWSDRYFRSDIETIKRIVNDLNRRMRDENYVSLNEFYAEIGLKYTEPGNLMGWNISRGYIDIHFSSHLTDAGDPCLAIEFYVAPQYDYDKLY